MATVAKRKPKKLTRAQTRVQIAKDVIAQLASRKTVARRNRYLRIGDDTISSFDARDAQEVLLKEKCTACAIGSIAVAACRRFDAAEIGRFVNVGFGDPLIGYLRPWFNRAELRRAEDIFEDGPKEGRAASLGARSTLTKMMRGVVKAKGAAGCLGRVSP